MDKKIKEIAKKENKKSVVKLNKKKSEDISLTQILKDNFKKFNKNSFRTVEVIFLVVVTSIISLIVGYLLNDEGTNKSKSNDKYINEIIDNYNNIVNNYYEDVDKSKLVSGAVNGMVESLGDEHSSLIDQTNDSTFNINLKGTYEGIGVEIINDDDMNIVVIGVISDSPAAKAGIKVGDIIKKIDDKSLENAGIANNGYITDFSDSFVNFVGKAVNQLKKYDIKALSRNLPIWATYEPGSTQKVVTMAASINEGIIDINKDKFYDSGSVMIGGSKIKCWKSHGHGEQTFMEVLQNSCNPGFVRLGNLLGKERLFSYLDKFGFGYKTGINLSGEGSGIIFPLNKVGELELATTAFGQGISVTPIQQVTAFSAVVNGGYLLRPYITRG